MSTRGFGSLVMAASVAGAALGCYLVSLKVASERARLESVEAQIASAERDIRVLETEIGTRGRLAQLERWNANFIRLSAPSADQILEGGFQLAGMVRPPAKPAIDAPVVLAAAPAGAGGSKPTLTSDSDEAKRPAAAAPADMMVRAGYAAPETKLEARPKPAKAASGPAAPKPAAPRPAKTSDPLAPAPSEAKDAAAEQ
jgi:hypothetical protein